MSKEKTEQPVQSVREVLVEAWSKIPRSPDMGDAAGKCGTALLLGGLLWMGVAPFLVGCGAVMILVSVLKGIR